MTIHPGLLWLEGSTEGRAWLARLPGLLDTCASRWSLELEEPYPYAFASLAVPARRADGSGAVLKVQFPGRESEMEATALARWAGQGAVRLIEHDPQRHALLVERCEPGRPLSELAMDDALDVMIGLLPRLWVPTSAPFRPLAEEALWWAGALRAQRQRADIHYPRDLLDAALDALAELPGSQSAQVLVNQDQHADNVLRAEREPWLVIDPKPLLGEREFGIAAIVRGGELGHSREALVHRLDRLTTELGLDRERARRWALAQTVAWSCEDDEPDPKQLQIVRWLHEA